MQQYYQCGQRKPQQILSGTFLTISFNNHIYDIPSISILIYFVLPLYFEFSKNPYANTYPFATKVFFEEEKMQIRQRSPFIICDTTILHIINPLFTILRLRTSPILMEQYISMQNRIQKIQNLEVMNAQVATNIIMDSTNRTKIRTY